jgi:hypothetical protein
MAGHAATLVTASKDQGGRRLLRDRRSWHLPGMAARGMLSQNAFEASELPSRKLRSTSPPSRRTAPRCAVADSGRGWSRSCSSTSSRLTSCFDAIGAAARGVTRGTRRAELRHGSALGGGVRHAIAAAGRIAGRARGAQPRRREWFGMSDYARRHEERDRCNEMLHDPFPIRLGLPKCRCLSSCVRAFRRPGIFRYSAVPKFRGWGQRRVARSWCDADS